MNLLWCTQCTSMYTFYIIHILKGIKRTTPAWTCLDIDGAALTLSCLNLCCDFEQSELLSTIDKGFSHSNYMKCAQSLSFTLIYIHVYGHILMSPINWFLLLFYSLPTDIISLYAGEPITIKSLSNYLFCFYSILLYIYWTYTNICIWLVLAMFDLWLRFPTYDTLDNFLVVLCPYALCGHN